MYTPGDKKVICLFLALLFEIFFNLVLYNLGHKKISLVCVTGSEKSEGGFFLYFSSFFYLTIMKQYTYLLNNVHCDEYFIDNWSPK